jgi:cytochrome c
MSYSPISPASTPLGIKLWLGGILLALLAIGATAAWNARQEQNRIALRAHLLTRGDPQRGPDAIQRFGCGGCHEIPGVLAARGSIGPPLSAFGQRAYVAGEVRNTPENLVHWIMHPHEIEAKTAMPEMGVGEHDARDIAAYLYTLN